MNTSLYLDESKIEEAVRCLQRYPEILAAYLHGSVVKASFRRDSDVDLAILLRPRHKLSPADRLDLAADLEGVFARTVDLGMLSRGNLVYAVQVAIHGRLLFSNDTLRSERFLAECMADYAELQVARTPILALYAT